MSEKDLEKARSEYVGNLDRIQHCLICGFKEDKTAAEAFSAGHASREAEVAKLEARVRELESINNWVPCKERQPEKTFSTGAQYLVTLRNHNFPEDDPDGFEVVQLCFGYLRGSDKPVWADEPEENVIAWQLMPKPYKEPNDQK